MKYFHGMCFLNSASTYLMIWSYENRMFPLLISNVEVQCHIRHVPLSLAGLWRSVLKELSPSFLSILHGPKCQTMLLREDYVFMDVPPKLLHCHCHVFLITKHVFAANLSCSLFKPAFQDFFHCAVSLFAVHAVHATRCVSAFQVASWRRSKRRAHWNGTWRVTEPQNR